MSISSHCNFWHHLEAKSTKVSGKQCNSVWDEEYNLRTLAAGMAGQDKFHQQDHMVERVTVGLPVMARGATLPSSLSETEVLIPQTLGVLATDSSQLGLSLGTSLS